MKCVKCGGEMEVGNTGAVAPVGFPYNFYWYIKNRLGFATNKNEVKVYHCKNCGYLESYAK